MPIRIQYLNSATSFDERNRDAGDEAYVMAAKFRDESVQSGDPKHNMRVPIIGDPGVLRRRSSSGEAPVVEQLKASSVG